MRPEPGTIFVRRYFRAMDLPQYLQGLSFRFVQPGEPASLTARAAAAFARLGLPLDALNTRLPFDRLEMGRKLRGTGSGHAGHSMAVRAILNRGVTHLGEDEAFVAFAAPSHAPLLAAIPGNPDKLCIGIEAPNAVQPGAPDRRRESLGRRFAKIANAERHFVEETFSGCIARLEGRAIGLLFVSAASHEPVPQRLAECEPHLAENAYVMVDNCNCAVTRQSVFDFMTASRNQYRVLWDARTPDASPLTIGRGLLAIQLLGRNAARRAERERAGDFVPAAA
jgi:hypothetical protein